MAEILYHK